MGKKVIDNSGKKQRKQKKEAPPFEEAFSECYPDMCTALDSYMKLVEFARSEEYGLGSEEYTEAHHIIPRKWYEKHGYKIDNSEKNLVRLRKRDHYKAHFYIRLCCEKNLKRSMQAAFSLMSGLLKCDCTEEWLDNKALLLEAQFLEKKYGTNGCKSKKPSAKTKALWSSQRKGVICITNGIEERHVFNVDDIPEGWWRGRLEHHQPLHTEESRKKMSETQRERYKKGAVNYFKESHYYNNGVEEKRFFEGDEIPEGWVKGKLFTHKGYKWTEEQRRCLSEVHKITALRGSDNPMYGKHPSEETRRKQSEAKKGKYIGEKHPNYGKVSSNRKREHCLLTDPDGQAYDIYDLVEFCKCHFEKPSTAAGTLRWYGKYKGWKYEIIDKEDK